MTELLLERLAQLEEAVRRATETIVRLREENGRLREENSRLREENGRLREERRQVLGQVDTILKDLAKLEEIVLGYMRPAMEAAA